MFRKNISNKVVNVKFEGLFYTFQPGDVLEVPSDPVVIPELPVCDQDGKVPVVVSDDSIDVSGLSVENRERVQGFINDLLDDGKRNYSPRKRKTKAKTVKSKK